MAVDFTVPGWLKGEVALWSQVLELDREFEIKIEMSLTPGDDVDADAYCSSQPDLNFALITFSVKAEDTSYWHQVVVHELLHVRHTRIDNVVRRQIIPEVNFAVVDIAKTAYSHVLEAYIEKMAKILMVGRAGFAARLLKGAE